MDTKQAQNAIKRIEAAEAKRLANEESKRQEAIEKAAYLASLPKRLMDMQALAISVGISVDVTLTSTGPSVQFHYETRTGGINETLTYTSEEWKVNYVQDSINNLKEKQDAAAARTIVARGVISKLSVDEKLALKENIWLL
jgi:hypothetical protein